MQRGESSMGRGSSSSKAPEVEKTCAHWSWTELGFESLEVGISERGGGKSGQEEAEDCFECCDMEVVFIIQVKASPSRFLSRGMCDQCLR